MLMHKLQSLKYRRYLFVLFAILFSFYFPLLVWSCCCPSAAMLLFTIILFFFFSFLRRLSFGNDEALSGFIVPRASLSRPVLLNPP